MFHVSHYELAVRPLALRLQKVGGWVITVSSLWFRIYRRMNTWDVNMIEQGLDGR